MRATPNMDFIRLLFTDPVEDEVAYRWASRFGALVGGQTHQLRPDTTLEDVLRWGVAAEVDSMDFVVVFEPELQMELARFLDYSDQISFSGTRRVNLEPNASDDLISFRHDRFLAYLNGQA